ncbi:hypothetical protein [Actinomadura madurae]|uniref:hypothetical protein n=1 Tax=Actinomadura madurae TaxID=1993 RepID=UPI0020D23788|nr:hypothetical protein [Actinomadura madurae]MCQ0017731.1 hypothetical protein [Actinomadura madurae]
MDTTVSLVMGVRAAAFDRPEAAEFSAKLAARPHRRDHRRPRRGAPPRHHGGTRRVPPGTHLRGGVPAP